MGLKQRNWSCSVLDVDEPANTDGSRHTYGTKKTKKKQQPGNEEKIHVYVCNTYRIHSFGGGRPHEPEVSLSLKITSYFIIMRTVEI